MTKGRRKICSYSLRALHETSMAVTEVEIFCANICARDAPGSLNSQTPSLPFCVAHFHIPTTHLVSLACSKACGACHPPMHSTVSAMERPPDLYLLCSLCWTERCRIVIFHCISKQVKRNCGIHGSTCSQLRAKMRGYVTFSVNGS